MWRKVSPKGASDARCTRASVVASTLGSRRSAGVLELLEDVFVEYVRPKAMLVAGVWPTVVAALPLARIVDQAQARKAEVLEHHILCLLYPIPPGAIDDKRVPAMYPHTRRAVVELALDAVRLRMYAFALHAIGDFELDCRRGGAERDLGRRQRLQLRDTPGVLAIVSEYLHYALRQVNRRDAAGSVGEPLGARVRTSARIRGSTRKGLSMMIIEHKDG